MTRRPDPKRNRRSTPPQPAWYDQANCRGKSELFYPPANETPSARSLRERYAAMICARCMVLCQCRDWARQQHEFGFWGGESEAARTAAGFVPRNPGERRSPAEPKRVAVGSARARRIRTPA
jgi:WhiB family redox-sensing transcriptional regulator